MPDMYGNQIREVGHGFVEGEDAYCLDAVRKARQEYICKGIIRAIRGAETFFPAGDALARGCSHDCTGNILKGDLHAVLTINDVEVFGTYWTHVRMCIPCALSEHIVEYRQTVLDMGEQE